MRRRKKLASLLPRRTTDTATNTRDTVDGQWTVIVVQSRFIGRSDFAAAAASDVLSCKWVHRLDAVPYSHAAWVMTNIIHAARRYNPSTRVPSNLGESFCGGIKRFSLTAARMAETAFCPCEHCFMHLTPSLTAAAYHVRYKENKRKLASSEM